TQSGMDGTWRQCLLRNAIHTHFSWGGGPQALLWNCSHLLERKTGAKKSTFPCLWNRTNERFSFQLAAPLCVSPSSQPTEGKCSGRIWTKSRLSERRQQR